MNRFAMAIYNEANQVGNHQQRQKESQLYLMDINKLANTHYYYSGTAQTIANRGTKDSLLLLKKANKTIHIIHASFKACPHLF